MAQSGYETVLQQIEENNTTLAALRKQTEAQKLSNLTGLLPENPEVAFNHLWGKPSYIGNNMDFAVTQTFDFPAVYRHRSKIARLQNENIDLPYKTQRTETLLSAKQTCIELVYYNILAKEYENWLQNARFIADAYKIKLEKGEINIIEHNKAHLNLTAVQIEIAQIEAERAVLLAQLKRLNGGKEIAFSAESYPAAALPQNFETWYASIESKNPELQYAQKQIDIDMQQIKLTRAEGFPKFWAGYAGEIERDKSSHGVIVGLSIPLWENRNRVSEAKAQVQASEFALKDNKVQFYNKLQSQYLKASALRQNAQKFRQSLNENDNKPLLKKALDAGEISMLDYLSEVEYYYNIMNKVLEAERDFEIAAAQLWAMEL
jgi:outer membrane protein TolC